MMLHAGFILPFLLLATADNNVRKQRTPGEVDGGYLTEAMYTQYRKADDWIPEPSFIDRAIPFFDIPGTKDAVLVFRCLFLAVLNVAVFVATTVVAVLQSGKEARGTCIYLSVLSGVAFIPLSIYLHAVVVYFKRR